MKLLHTISAFREWRASVTASRTPFVPTMGALHDGHASLVREARAMAGESGRVIASIFVNPTQFGPAEDFTRYPRTLDADCQLLEAAGCDVVFVPTAEEMYGRGGVLNSATQNSAGVTVDPGAMGDVLEGAIRPGHFRGVCTVVAKLLGITQPSHLLLGQKDFQQQAIIRRMCVDLNMGVEVVTCPTLRESDGLAMSSRNRYLSAEERPRAIGLYEALAWARDAYGRGERQASLLDAGMEQRLEARGLVPQYAVCCDPGTLISFREVGKAVALPAVLLVAAKLGATRLIDNLFLPMP